MGMCAYIAKISDATGKRRRLIVLEAPTPEAAHTEARKYVRMGEWLIACVQRDYCP